MPENQAVTVNDLIREEVTFQTNELDDKVLMKSGGLPTYHLANIVDDHLMEITHVIRGEEWLPSTGLHVMMYRCFGWEDSMPKFAHLPLILKPAPSTYVTKKTKGEFTENFATEFMKSADPEMSLEEVKKIVAQVFSNPKDIQNQLKIGKNDDGKKKAVKTFLKNAMYGKLSKRDGDRLGFPVFPLSWEGKSEADSFVGFKEIGFDAKAVNNFLVFLGWNPGTEQEMFSMREMIDAFSLERVGKSGAKFDYEKARWFNQQYLMNKDDEKIAEELRVLLSEKGFGANLAFLKKVAAMMKERVHFIPEILESGYYLFEPIKSYDDKTIQKRWKPESREKMNLLASTIKGIMSFDATTIESSVKQFMEEQELGFGEVLPILRLAVSGTTMGPSVFDIMALLGHQETSDRMVDSYKYFDEVILNEA